MIMYKVHRILIKCLQEACNTHIYSLYTLLLSVIKPGINIVTNVLPVIYHEEFIVELTYLDSFDGRSSFPFGGSCNGKDLYN
jgi:hypothetical protein